MYRSGKWDGSRDGKAPSVQRQDPSIPEETQKAYDMLMRSSVPRSGCIRKIRPRKEVSDKRVCPHLPVFVTQIRGICSEKIFCFDNRRKVNYIVTDPALCTYNGEALNVNRDKILEILGAPYMMGWTHWELENVPEEYYIDYYDGKEGARICMPSPEEAATDIRID